MSILSQKPWALSTLKVLKMLNVSSKTGLDDRAVHERLERYGANRLKEIRKKSLWIIWISQFKNFLVGMLAGAAILSFFFGDWIDSVAILAVVAINALIGFITEVNAVKSMEALQKLVIVSTKVRRDGRVVELPAESLVPGDIVILEAGDLVSADLRLISASKLQLDESALTGESVPVEKNVEPVGENKPLAERNSMLYQGTAVTRGSGEGVVVATGMKTELGQITSLVEEAKAETTPLEKRLDQLGNKLIWVTLSIAGVVAVSGILTGKDILLMIETSIALAVAAIPEGLPIVATIALARGMWRMAKRNALINRLSAVETLGAVDIICTDKTGTLTENRMTLTRLALDSGPVDIAAEGASTKNAFNRDSVPVHPESGTLLRRALEVGVLCNNAELHHDARLDMNRAVGDPLEVALLIAGVKAGLQRRSLLNALPEIREEAFDSDLKMMATFHQDVKNILVAVKGAPEAVLQCSSSVLTEKGEKKLTPKAKARWLQTNHDMARNGFRILAYAIKTVERADAKPYEKLVLVGLAGLMDPPRQDARQAIQECQQAGIRVVMVTGDQAVTAENIGKAVGLEDRERIGVVHENEIQPPGRLNAKNRLRLLKATLFARVSPRQKLDLIELHQKNGSIVAMTGDGVNDAPALKKADIGVAMGLRGTQVAREAADMVLKDDSFATIVAAVAQGRVIFNNIRKCVFFLISCNISEVAVVGLASVLNRPLPILPLQILFVNLVTDVFPALALGAGKGDPDVMKRPPRNSREPILTRHYWLASAGYGMVITVSVLAALELAMVWLHMEYKQAVTISFLTLAISQLFHVFNMRDYGSNALRNDITRNPFIWIGLVLCVGMVNLAVYNSVLSKVLKVENPGSRGWLLIVAMSMVVYVVGQTVKAFSPKKWN